MIPFPFSFWKTQGVVGNGSMAFVAASSMYLTVPGSTDWAVGTGDFTVEGWMYQTNNGNTNYLFSLGTGNNFAVGIASGGGRLSGYMGGSRISNQTIANATNTWFYWAVTRSSGTYNMYFNGTRTDTLANSTNITDAVSVLYIGWDGSGAGAYWPGNMTNFRFTKGSALYTGATMTIPTSNLTAGANTKLLLNSQNSANLLTDSSGTGKVVTNVNGVSFSALTPY